MKTLKLIVTTLLLTSLFGCQCCKTNEQSCPKKTEKKIVLQLYSVRDDIQKDFKGTIAAVAEMGFKDIEAAGYGDGMFYGLAPEEFKAQLAAVGLNPLSSHTAYQLAKNVSETDWDAVWNWWDVCIATHKAAGMEYLVFPWMEVPESLADLKVYCDYFNKIGEKCNQAGILFGYHNHAFEFQEIEGVTMLDFMIQNTDPDKVFFQLDVYWAVMGLKSAVEYFKNYHGRFTMLHIKDVKELGESGMVGFDAIYKYIDTAGAIYSVIEVEKYNYEPLVSVKMSFEYLKNAPF